MWSSHRPRSGKSESAKYETLLLRSLRHIEELGETKPGDVRVSKEELLSQLNTLRNAETSEHVLCCHIADILGLTYPAVRQLADLAELGPQYNADSRIPKADIPRIRTLKLREKTWPHRSPTWHEIYNEADAALLSGDLAAAGWHLERIRRRDYSAYLAIRNLRLAYLLATKTLDQLTEHELWELKESRITWGTTETFSIYLDHITILDPHAEPLVRQLLKRPKLRYRPPPRRRKMRRR